MVGGWVGAQAAGRGAVRLQLDICRRLACSVSMGAWESWCQTLMDQSAEQDTKALETKGDHATLYTGPECPAYVSRYCRRRGRKGEGTAGGSCQMISARRLLLDTKGAETQN
jgi:hypothetical protein